MKPQFDVVVAGGGPAGSAAALGLGRRGVSVALIEQDTYQSPRVGETLPPIIRQQLTALGVWGRFLRSGPLESYGIQTAWESDDPRDQDFLRNPYGCGWHVDRARFDAMLAQAAAEAGAELIAPARIAGCAHSENGHWLLEAVQGQTVRKVAGRMLLDATGRKALLATQLGAQARVTDRLVAAVDFSPAREPAQQTLIEAVEQGWWYSAPIPGNRMVFAYLTDSDLWMNADWSQLLNQAPLTAARVGSSALPPPQLVSAASIVRCPVAGPDWMAVGDAALAYDPLSGQGVFKSIETGLQCAEAVARYFGGDAAAPAKYETWVQKTYETYLAQRRDLYRAVGRWPQSRFWNRRGASAMSQ